MRIPTYLVYSFYRHYVNLQDDVILPLQLFNAPQG